MTLLGSRPSTPSRPSPQLIGEHVDLAPPLADHSGSVLSLAVDGDRLFATHYYGLDSDPHSSPAKGTLHVLDRVSLAELTPPIEVGWQPRQVVVNPVARRIYVFNYGADSKDISVVGLDSLQPEGELEVEGNWPIRMAVDPGRNRLYVLTHPSGELVAFNGNDHSIHGRVTLGQGLTDLAFDDAERRLFVTRFLAGAPFEDQLLEVDTTLLATPIQITVRRHNLPFRSRPRQVVHHPELDRVYIRAEGVAGASPPGIIELDPATSTPTQVVTEGGPVELALDRFHEMVHLLTNQALNSYSIAGFTPSATPSEPLPGVPSLSAVVDPETSTVLVGNGASRITKVHPDMTLGDAPHAAAGAVPTMVGLNGGMILAVVGNDDKLRIARWSEETDWDFGLGWIEAPDTVPAGTPLAGISRINGVWELFCVRADRQLWRLSGNVDGTINGWTALGGQFPLRSHVTAFSRYEGNWSAMAVDDGGQVFNAGGDGDEIFAGTLWGGHPALTPGAPIAAVSRKSDHWDMFVLTAGGDVWTTWWGHDHGPGGWGSRGGSFSPGTPLTALTRHRNSIELFATDPAGQVLTQYLHTQDGWSGWRNVRNDDNVAVPGAAVGAMARNEDSIDIFVVRTDRQVWTTGWSDGWSSWRPLGGRAARPGALVATRHRPGTDQWMHICWVSDGGIVETAWWNRVQPLDGWSITNGVRLRLITESKHFFSVVPTDTDNLSGQVHTRLWRDGTFLVSGHMHDSGFDPYRFSTSSAVLSEEGYSVVNVGTGHVDGTGSDWSPDRDAYWNDVGNDEKVAGAYDELAAGAATANCTAKNIGLGGGLDAIVHAVFHDFLDPLVIDPLRKFNKAAFSIGPAANKLFGFPVFIGPQSIFTYTHSVGWLTGLGYVIPLLPWHAELGALDPFIEHRQLEGWEYDVADQVFQGKLPPRERIWLTDGTGVHKHPFIKGSKGREFVFPLGPGDDDPVLVNLGEAFEDPTTFANDKNPTPGQLFIHEMTHVWDLHNTGLDKRKWLLRGTKDGNYTVPPATTPWADFGLEQKASTVEEWYARHIGHGLDSNPALHDAYFKFIHLVRLGVTGD
jgi:hypothetical protein